MVDKRLQIYKNKKVFITGHTGFKGSWLCLTLQKLGCEIYAYSLSPDSNPNHYNLVNPEVRSFTGDIRDYNLLKESLQKSNAEIVFHLAAQSLVRPSYSDPIYTYEVNLLGSLNLLQAASTCPHVKAIVMVTTDKVYDNVEKNYYYREEDRLGGYDMYSSSKACCELMIHSFRNSFFNLQDYGRRHDKLIASVRAGNVIGGGDWCKDRLIPDLVKTFEQKQTVQIRNPNAIRPWQHVLDCLQAYLIIGSGLLSGHEDIACAWNVAPIQKEIFTVKDVLDQFKSQWDEIQFEIIDNKNQPHEASILMLDASNLQSKLFWKPKYNTKQSIDLTIEWYKKYYLENTIISINQVDSFFDL